MPPSALSPTADVSLAQFAADARAYLTRTPRQMASRYFYDALGSRLFDAICELPWYRVTRAETMLLARHGREILRQSGTPARIVELGSGSGAKLAVLAESRGRHAGPIQLHLIDISPAALETAARALDALPNVEVVTHHATYESGLAAVTDTSDGHGVSDAASNDRATDTTLALFLGSNIGNFDRAAGDGLLTKLRAALAPGDCLLLGTDLVKPEAELLMAYDDPLGVTAAFNLNLFARMNRELGANFALDQLKHVALWNAQDSRVEMHIESLSEQRIVIPAASLEFVLARGERIWTENSHKYTPLAVDQMLARSGFVIRQRWTDVEAGFALTLAVTA
jgi:dimethylhistidine N-methyltransferase